MSELLQKALPVKTQFEIRDAITQRRLQMILPSAMMKAGIDMWVVLAEEYNEDPVFYTLVPSAVENASRLTCLVFTLLPDGSVEMVSVNKPNRELARFYETLPYSSHSQWDVICNYIVKKNPGTIGLNYSQDSALASGLTTALYNTFCAHLDSTYLSRLRDAEQLCVLWMEERLEEELELYPAVYAMTLQVLDRGLSNEVLVPGISTTEDLEWFCAQQYHELGLPLCFRPTFNFQRKGSDNPMQTGVIHRGDLLHYDAGIKYLGLSTDVQRLAYVRRLGEEAAPSGIRKGFNLGQLFGRLAGESFVVGRTGNEVFSSAIAKAREEGIEAMLYSHPIGLNCHGLGPVIGLYDNQGPIPVRGDRELHLNTAYALEYNVACPVAEWNGQKVFFFLEETVLLRESAKITYLDSNWNELMLV